MTKRTKRPRFEIVDDKTVRQPMPNGEYTYVDMQDIHLLRNHNWTKQGRGYAATGVKQDDGTIQWVRLHRLIMNAKPGQIVDHIDGDPYNNRRSNLRIVTESQNQANRYRHNSVTGFKGVSVLNSGNRSKRFKAKIVSNKKDYFLGTFSTPQEAAQAYDEAALFLFGAHARTNAQLGLLNCSTPPIRLSHRHF